MTIDLEKRIAALEARVDQMIRTGTVVSVDMTAGTVRVQCQDADGLSTFHLPVLFRKTLADKEYVMPDVGEHVLCVFLPFGLSQGFVVGAFYSSVDAVPVVSMDKWHIRFKNGATLEHDRNSGRFSMDLTGDLDIHCAGEMLLWSEGTMYLDAPNIKTFERKG